MKRPPRIVSSWHRLASTHARPPARQLVAPALAFTLAITLASASAGCGEDSSPVPAAADPSGEGTAVQPTDPLEKPDDDDDDTTPADPKEIVADLRADTNRDGVVSFTDKTDDTGEDTWNEKQGAVFLANIDDDEVACPTNLDDVELPKCNDAADDVLNGAEDALDLARIATRPWPTATAGASAQVSWTGADHVRLFLVEGPSFTVVESGTKLTRAQLEGGIELAIEGRDVVRDPAVWDGHVDLTLAVSADGKTKSDKVRMRVAPVVTSHHLSPTESTWVSSFKNAGNQALRDDLATATTAAALPAPRGISTSDSWAQDFFETAFMSMPAAGGKQHAIRVNIRSANEQSPQKVANPLRPAGRVVWLLRGKDSAGLQEYDPTRNGRFDTLNSFGNFETVPPYTFGGQSYPLGRVLRGKTDAYYPDKVFTRMIEAQKVQPAIYVDTSWLIVGHVDETLSFVKAKSARGWVLLVNDARLARTMFEAQSKAGRGSTPLHVGKYWDKDSPAQVTIDQVLADTDVMAASAQAAAEVDAQVAILKAETGLTDAEIVRIPFLHMETKGLSIAYQPGLVNGLYLADGHFVAPAPHGPVVGGKDIFEAATSAALAPLDITVHFAEDWDTYHRNLGEVHCGTNSVRQIPQAKWWESGR